MYASVSALLWLVLCLGAGFAVAAAAEDANDAPRAEGTWQGTLEFSGQRLRLAAHIRRGAGGMLTGTLDSIDQRATGLPLDAVNVTEDVLSFQVTQIGARYAGNFYGADTIRGVWSQGLNSVPLILQRDDDVPVARRPQDPVPPLPYEQLQVIYDSVPGVRLAGTLTVPRGRGPFPAVVLITGSGPQDRDETLAGHRPFYVISDALTRRGMAVLRTDDRGVGQSTGDYASATTADFAQDALAGVRFLLQQPQIDATRIGLIGHSEGAIVAPLAASLDVPEARHIIFVVMLAGTGVPLGDVLLEQQRLLLQSQRLDPAAVAASDAVLKRMIEIASTENDSSRAADAMREALRSYAARLPEPLRAQVGGQQEARIAQMNSPWMRWILRYDPAATLRKLRVPVLALFGSRDLQAPPLQNVPPIKAALRSPDSEVLVLRNLNHLFQTARTGSIAEYAQLEETFNPVALKIVGDWVLERVRARR